MKNFKQIRNFFLLIIILGVFGFTSNPNQINLEKFIELNKGTFNGIINWKEIEKNIPRKDRVKFAIQIASQINFPYVDTTAICLGQNFNSFLENIHFIDLNGDSILDAIYQGFSLGEGEMVNVFLNKNGQLKEIFNNYQQVKSIDLDKEGHLKSIIILDDGCCASYMNFESQYNFDKNYVAKMNFSIAKPHFMEVANFFFQKPRMFSIMNENYSLRSSPVVDDTSTIIYTAVNKGNLLAKYPKGSIGFAWAEKADCTGRVWWLVEMNPCNNLKNKIVYNKDTIPPHFVGWMSSRFLQEIEQ